MTNVQGFDLRFGYCVDRALFDETRIPMHVRRRALLQREADCIPRHDPHRVFTTGEMGLWNDMSAFHVGGYAREE